jgi:hypothetical protein
MAPTPTSLTESALPRSVVFEPTITLAEAARCCRTANGRPVHPATIARWIFRGVRQANGKRLRLAAVQRSGRWVTDLESLNRFVAAQTLVAAPNTEG